MKAPEKFPQPFRPLPCKSATSRRTLATSRQAPATSSQARDELRGVRDELPDSRDQPPGARDEPPGGALEASRCLQETPRRLLGNAAVSLLETLRGVQAPNLQKHYTFNRSSLSDMGPL